MQPEGDYRIPTLEAALGWSLSFRRLSCLWVFGAQHAMRLSDTGGANSSSCSTFCCEHPNTDFTTGWCATQLDSKFGLFYVVLMLCWCCFMLFWPASLWPFQSRIESRPGSPGFAPGKVASSCWPAGQVDFVPTKSIKIWENPTGGILDFLLRAKAFQTFQTFNTFDVFSFVVTLSPLKF